MANDKENGMKEMLWKGAKWLGIFAVAMIGLQYIGSKV